MAGHSKWAKIKHKKGINDAKKGKIFSKLAQQISVCVRDGGSDTAMNFSLRLLIEKAKSVSMPQDNIARAIATGAGEGGKSVIEEMMYEGFGPDGVGFIVKCLTDNKNRTVAQIREIFDNHGGKLGDNGSVSWNYDHRAMIVLLAAKKVPSEKFGQEDLTVDLDVEEVTLAIMDIPGVLDIIDSSDGDSPHTALEVYGEVKDMAKIRDNVVELGYIVESIDLVWIPRNLKDGVVMNEPIMSFMEALEDNDDVQDIWCDIELT